MNPLFPDSNDPYGVSQGGYLVPGQGSVAGGGAGPGHPRIDPLSLLRRGAANPAADLVRHKLDALYAQEPSARQELAESQAAAQPRSKHQQFMYDLSVSGRSLAEIQSAWHNYYASLQDHEKHEIWQEFYSNSARTASAYGHFVQHNTAAPAGQAVWGQHGDSLRHAQPQTATSQHHQIRSWPIVGDLRKFAAIKARLLRHVRARSRAPLKAMEHLKSLAFGIGLGGLVVLVSLFGLFNQVVIAPLIQPGGYGPAAPIILTADDLTPGSGPELIVPKINVQLPIVYDSPSAHEDVLQKVLEKGIAHYPTTVRPGQKGNAAYFGHSSNNIFNKGKYKFAFVLLHDMEPGDLFYLTYKQKVYTYKVYQKRVVEPTDTWVLDNVKGKTSTVTLITCDPPGTSKHRLVVWGEQISPEPGGNKAAAVPKAAEPQALPSDGPSLWSRFWHWLF